MPDWLFYGMNSLIFFFSSRRRHTRLQGDWSSDVCSSDLVEELAANASIPVINGLTDSSHPCQALADVMTIRERFGRLEGIKVVYLGDGNNVCASLMVACAKLGMDFVAATPPDYRPADEAVVIARAEGHSVELVDDPLAAVEGADVLYTDVWTSIGQD